MYTLTIEVEAKDWNGIELSVEEALRIIKTGCVSGMNGNDDENFSYHISGFEEERTDEDIEEDNREPDIQYLQSPPARGINYNNLRPAKKNARKAKH